MSSPPRKAVMDAVFAMIESMTFEAPIGGRTTWAIAERRLRLWGEVPSTQQPYVALVTHSETGNYRGLGLARNRLNLMCYCYTKAPKTLLTQTGQDQLDIILDAFDAKFGQDAVDDFSTNQNTLGGLVYWCRLDGKVFKDPGDLDEQTLLVVPILVEMP